MPDVVVAGAGMAGLAAAAEARRLGATPLVLEKLPRPGGSMLLSSGVIWRHRDLETFRKECPGGDERLQRLLFERLDEDLGWLESVGAPVVQRDTGNPVTTGTRFDPETRRILGVAFELVCIALRTEGSDDFVKQANLAKAGERNPDLLCEQALKDIRSPPPNV